MSEKDYDQGFETGRDLAWRQILQQAARLREELAEMSKGIADLFEAVGLREEFAKVSKGVAARDEAKAPVDPVETAAEATERTWDPYAPQTVQIEVPIGPPLGEEGGCPDQVELVRCNCGQRKGIWRLFVGLSLSKTQTANGELVVNQEEAVLWLLEQVAREVEKRDGAER